MVVVCVVATGERIETNGRKTRLRFVACSERVAKESVGMVAVDVGLADGIVGVVDVD